MLFIATSLLIGMVKVPWEFLLSFGILMSMALAVFQVPLVSAITMWFQKHLGVAMGLLQAAQGLSNVLFAPLMVVLLSYGGWRWAFWGPGIVGGVLLLVLIGSRDNRRTRSDQLQTDFALRPALTTYRRA